MDYKDKATFDAKLKENSKKLRKNITDEETEIFYEELKEYPLEILTEAMVKAIRDRDPDDIYSQRAGLTCPEIRIAADRILEGKPKEGRLGCERCGGKGWITNVAGSGGLIAWPCECLYKIAKEALRRKKRSGSEQERLDRYRKIIINAYEYHQKNWSEEA